MTREERLKFLKQIEKDIHVCSLESTLADDMKSCAIHSVIEELEQQEPILDKVRKDIKDLDDKDLEKEPCEITAEEYRQRMIQAFHNADCDELIAICVLPTEKEFEHLEWLLKNHYKKEPCENCSIKHELEVNLKKWANAYRRGLKDGKREALEQEPKIVKMRDATPEERESIDKYIKSISTTGVDFWDLEQEPILNKIRAEIVNLTNGDTPERIWNVDVLNIIDKYKAESEVEE